MGLGGACGLGRVEVRWLTRGLLGSVKAADLHEEKTGGHALSWTQRGAPA